jgi:hypothetical protein
LIYEDYYSPGSYCGEDNQLQVFLGQEKEDTTQYTSSQEQARPHIPQGATVARIRQLQVFLGQEKGDTPQYT